LHGAFSPPLEAFDVDDLCDGGLAAYLCKWSVFRRVVPLVEALHASNSRTTRRLGSLPKLGIGMIEESDKLILPLVFYFLSRYRSEAAGIVLGVATAAGFASLETMGYGFVSLLQAKGNLGVLDGVLLVRGLSSPAGHMSWTGLVCAVLWRERLKAGHATLSWRIVGAFLTAVVLHALWDTFASLGSANLVEFLGVGFLSLLVALVGLVLLIRRVGEARQASAA
jgi:RsiW-degrading membrane proteinase PrsW (M82 family)